MRGRQQWTDGPAAEDAAVLPGRMIVLPWSGAAVWNGSKADDLDPRRISRNQRAEILARENSGEENLQRNRIRHRHGNPWPGAMHDWSPLEQDRPPEAAAL
jgi:hypothetical protein